MSTYLEYLNKKDDVVDEHENSQSRVTIDRWIFGLFLVLLGVMPLLVFGNVEEVISPLISNVDMLSSGVKSDLFTHYKSIMLLIFTAIISIMFFIKIFFMDGQLKKTILNYFIGAFVIAIVLSTIFSPNITIALNGQYNRSDGALSWLCYIALMFIAMNIEYPKNVVRYIMYTMIPFVYINLYIITMNFYSKDLLQKSWLQKLVSSTLPEGAGLSEGSQLVGTLNQWNYMSGMFAVMAIFYLAWSLTEKNLIQSIIGMVTSVVSTAIMLMALSTSGFLTMLVTLIFVVLLIFKVTNKKKAIGLLLGFVVLNTIVFNVLANENKRIWDESFGFIISNNPYEGIEEVSISKLLDSKVYAADEVFELPVLPEAGWAPGTGRLYIWEKTMDLVKERPLFGYGMDSIAYNFPHYNIDARGGNNSENTIVDKPHNMYLGVLYGTGIVGGIALLLLVGAVCIIGLREVFINKNVMLGGVTCAVIAFAIQAMFNDSLPGMVPLLFVLMGILVVKSKEQIIEV